MDTGPRPARASLSPEKAAGHQARAIGWRVLVAGRAMLWLGCGLAGLALAGSARSEPMRLGDASPRRVHVEFEVSPSDRPELLDAAYSEPFDGWVEPGDDGTIHVRVAGAQLERGLLRDRNPVPGSFSDYLWVFDTRTGEVLSASFSGTLVHLLRWGFGTTEIEVRVGN